MLDVRFDSWRTKRGAVMAMLELLIILSHMSRVDVFVFLAAGCSWGNRISDEVLERVEMHGGALVGVAEVH